MSTLTPEERAELEEGIQEWHQKLEELREKADQAIASAEKSSPHMLSALEKGFASLFDVAYQRIAQYEAYLNS